jgi:hypothetical protein
MYLPSWNSNLLLFGSWVLIRKYYTLSCFYLETYRKRPKIESISQTIFMRRNFPLAIYDLIVLCKIP